MTKFHSVQSLSCVPTLCDPMDSSMPGFPVHHQLPELAQTHVRWVGDAIQPSHLISSSKFHRHLSTINLTPLSFVILALTCLQPHSLLFHGLLLGWRVQATSWSGDERERWLGYPQHHLCSLTTGVHWPPGGRGLILHFQRSYNSLSGNVRVSNISKGWTLRLRRTSVRGGWAISSFSLKNVLLIWLRLVLVVAQGISDLCCSVWDLDSQCFSCGVWTLSCSTWNLVPWPKIEPRPPALGTQNLSHCTTEEVPGMHYSAADSLSLTFQAHCLNPPKCCSGEMSSFGRAISSAIKSWPQISAWFTPLTLHLWA